MLTGSMSVKENVTGPIGIFYILQKSRRDGHVARFVHYGVISASLAIFNLLPVIPLDGGHLLLLGIERLRGRALSARTDEYVAKVGFSLIVLWRCSCSTVIFHVLDLSTRSNNYFLRKGEQRWAIMKYAT